MTAPASDPVVAVVLSVDAPPSLVALSEKDQAASSIHLDGISFTDTGAGDWLGFYDWLRNSEGTVLGVRQYIDDRSSILLEKSFSGTEVEAEHGIVRIYFGEERDFDETKSCDQSFGDNRLLVAERKVALTFYAGHLE